MAPTAVPYRFPITTRVSHIYSTSIHVDIPTHNFLSLLQSSRVHFTTISYQQRTDSTSVSYRHRIVLQRSHAAAQRNHREEQSPRKRLTRLQASSSIVSRTTSPGIIIVRRTVRHFHERNSRLLHAACVIARKLRPFQPAWPCNAAAD